MVDSLDVETLHDIYDRIEYKITLGDCETAQEMIEKMKRHPAGITNQTKTLIDLKFFDKFVEMGFNKRWSYGVWKNRPDHITKLRRDEKGRFVKGRQLKYEYDDFILNMERYVPADEIVRIRQMIFDKRRSMGLL